MTDKVNDKNTLRVSAGIDQMPLVCRSHTMFFLDYCMAKHWVVPGFIECTRAENATAVPAPVESECRNFCLKIRADTQSIATT
jgi:hypothetical protein